MKGKCRTGKKMLSRLRADRLMLDPTVIRVYRCNFCGWWHRTSKEMRTT